MQDTFHTSAKAIVTNQRGGILLIEYQDLGEVGVHYNLPGGRIKRNELAIEACIRKCREEAGVAVDEVRFAFVYEYIGVRLNNYGADKHSIGIVFTAKVDADSIQMLTPSCPDEIQTRVIWLPLSKLDTVVLWPSCKEVLTAFATGDRTNGEYIGLVL